MNVKPVIVTGFVLESSRIMKNNFKLICTTYVQIYYEHGSGGKEWPNASELRETLWLINPVLSGL